MNSFGSVIFPPGASFLPVVCCSFHWIVTGMFPHVIYVTSVSFQQHSWLIYPTKTNPGDPEGSPFHSTTIFLIFYSNRACVTAIVPTTTVLVLQLLIILRKFFNFSQSSFIVRPTFSSPSL